MTKSRERQKGQAAVELVAQIVVFALMIVLVATLSFYLYIHHTLLTAAREGARTASVSDAFATNDNATGIGEVRDRVQELMLAAAGQTLTDGNITVTPPDAAGTFGSRSVTVHIDYTITNPIPVNAFLQSITGNSYDNLEGFPVEAEASMRFEE